MMALTTADRRANLIIGFALRFLFDNFESDIEEDLNDVLNDKEQPSLIESEELCQMAESFEHS